MTNYLILFLIIVFTCAIATTKVTAVAISIGECVTAIKGSPVSVKFDFKFAIKLASASCFSNTTLPVIKQTIAKVPEILKKNYFVLCVAKNYSFRKLVSTLESLGSPGIDYWDNFFI